MENVTPENHIARIPVPLLLLHGENDRFVPPENMEILYAKANLDLTQKHLLTHCRHFNVIKDANCGVRIVAFFGDHLTQLSQ